jgi:integrase
MPQRKLTAAAIPHLAEAEWWDVAVPGLILRVGKKRRSWSFRYHAGGSYHRAPLGHFPAVELGEARDAARTLIGRLDSGAPLPASTPHPRSVATLTLDGLFNAYEATRLREGVKVKALPKVMRALRRNLKPWLTLPAGEFSKTDLRAARDTMIAAGAPVEANRLLVSVGAVLRWASEEDLVEVNFAPAIRRTPEQKRQRVLSRPEIKAIWHACDKLGSSTVARNYGRLVRFLLLTGQRRSEVASLRYGHLLDGTWRQIENKVMRPHNIPLPPLALNLIGRGDARDYAFGGRDGQIGAFSRLKRALDRTSGVSDWVIHDIRRSVASHMQDLGIRNEVVQAVLNHAVPGVGQIYLRAQLEQQKADALARWATALTKIVGPLRVTA